MRRIVVMGVSGCGKSTVAAAMAAELGLEVVAKCVETRAQLDLVRGLGCGFAQGYLLHRPMDLDSLVACLREEERNRAGCGA